MSSIAPSDNIEVASLEEAHEATFRLGWTDGLLDEMETLKNKYKLDGFYIFDDLLMLSEGKFTDFCNGILERGLNIKYDCTGRFNAISPEIIRLLKESGCISVFFGFESGNEKLWETMSKRTTLEQIYEAIRLTREAGIYCSWGTMFGQPCENEKTLRDTVELIKNLSCGEYRTNKMFRCIPFPGSGIYDWCKEKGLIKDDQDFYERYINQHWSLDQLPVNMTDLTDEQAERLFREANQELSDFYIGKMAEDWVRVFGADSDSFVNHDPGSGSMRHLRTRIESTASTYDTSGRTG